MPSIFLVTDITSENWDWSCGTYKMPRIRTCPKPRTLAQQNQLANINARNGSKKNSAVPPAAIEKNTVIPPTYWMMSKTDYRIRRDRHEDWRNSSRIFERTLRPWNERHSRTSKLSATFRSIITRSIARNLMQKEVLEKNSNGGGPKSQKGSTSAANFSQRSGICESVYHEPIRGENWLSRKRKHSPVFSSFSRGDFTHLSAEN